ncbi:LPS-assembly lipoprotein LptE [Pseudomonas putida]
MIKRNLLVMGLAMLLGACGFQLRGTGTNELALKELNVVARDAYGPTVIQLRKQIQAAGVKVYDGAPYKLSLSREQETQRSASYTSGTRSAEYELTTTLSYDIIGRNNLNLMSDHIVVDKTYTQDGNNLAGSDQVAQQTRDEIRREIIQRLMLRLEQIKPDELAKLQADAEAKAKALEEQEAEAQRIRDETPQQSPVQIPSK